MAQIFGSTVAAPFVKTVLEDALHYGGVLPTSSSATVQVPDVTGLSVEEATEKLEQYGLAVFAESSTGSVTAQVPAAGETVVTGYSVLLYTGIDDINNDEPYPTPEPQYAVMPDLKGMTPLQAHDALAALGLIMDCEPDPHGYVYMQDVPKGTTVLVGIKIKVYFTPVKPEE